MGHPWIPDVKVVNYATVKTCSASPVNKHACWASERDLNNREYSIFTGHVLSGTEGPGAQFGQTNVAT